MRRLILLLCLFAVALLTPVGYLVARTYQSLAQEEEAKLRFFAHALFDEVEQDLEAFVSREESRSLLDYGYYSSPESDETGTGLRSPLSRMPMEDWILGYFQNNPDGSFQTPLLPPDRKYPHAPVETLGGLEPEVVERIRLLDSLNQRFNRAWLAGPLSPAEVVDEEGGGSEAVALAEPYLKVNRQRPRRDALGAPILHRQTLSQELARLMARNMPAAGGERRSSEHPSPSSPAMEVEVAPLQAVALDRDHVYVFRRVVLENSVYRQGCVIVVQPFLRHLADRHFSGQPMAQYASLWLKAVFAQKGESMVQAGAVAQGRELVIHRGFPRPFDFLDATLACDEIPRSPGRTALNVLTVGIVLVVLFGLGAIYRGAAVVQEQARRRAGFVSSVTHELKTPLTNIRLYLDILEQGLARDPERLREYLGVVRQESARLQRLVSNVLEFARLEKGRESLYPEPRDMEIIIRDALRLMEPKAAREGFRFQLQAPEHPLWALADREALLQVLLNLLENSLKFCSEAERKDILISLSSRNGYVDLAVRDFGPGVPEKALRKIFQDFYRVDDSLTRKTQGTGIGLALSKRLIIGMGGEILAMNAKDGGLVVRLRLQRTDPPREARDV